jgi:hypothetical protein
MPGPEERREHIRSLRGRGLTQEEIANELGVSRATVARDLASLKEEHASLPADWKAPVVIKGDAHSIESQPLMTVSLDAFERLREDAVVFETEAGQLFAFHPSGYTITSKLRGISYAVASPLLASLDVDVLEYLNAINEEHQAASSASRLAKSSMLKDRTLLIRQGLAAYGNDWLFPLDVSEANTDEFLVPFYREVCVTVETTLQGTMLEDIISHTQGIIGLPVSLRINSRDWAQTEHAPVIFKLIEEISRGVNHLELLKNIAAAYEAAQAEFDSFLPLSDPEGAAKKYVEAISSIPKSRLKAAMQQRIADKNAWDEFIHSNALSREDWEDLKASDFDDWNEYSFFESIQDDAYSLLEGPWAHLRLNGEPEDIILHELTSMGWDAESLSGALRLVESGYKIEPEEAPLVEDLLHIDLNTIDGSALKKYINDNGTAWIDEGSNPFDIELMQALLNGPMTVALVKLLDTAKQHSGLGRKVSNVDELHEVLSQPPFVDICTSELESGIVTKVKDAPKVLDAMKEKNKPERVIPARLKLKAEQIPGYIRDLNAGNRNAQRLLRAMVADDVEEATILCWRYLSYTVAQAYPQSDQGEDEQVNVRIIERLEANLDLSKKRIGILHTVRQVRNDLEHPEGEKSGKRPSWPNIAEVLKILELCTQAEN